MIGTGQQPEHRRAAQRADLRLPHARRSSRRREVVPAEQGEGGQREAGHDHRRPHPGQPDEGGTEDRPERDAERDHRLEHAERPGQHRVAREADRQAEQRHVDDGVRGSHDGEHEQTDRGARAPRPAPRWARPTAASAIASHAPRWRLPTRSDAPNEPRMPADARARRDSAATPPSPVSSTSRASTTTNTFIAPRTALCGERRDRTRAAGRAGGPRCGRPRRARAARWARAGGAGPDRGRLVEPEQRHRAGQRPTAAIAATVVDGLVAVSSTPGQDRSDQHARPPRPRRAPRWRSSARRCPCTARAAAPSGRAGTPAIAIVATTASP